MKSKLLVIGPNSPHVARFLNLVKDLFAEVVYVGEDDFNSDVPVRRYKINFHTANPFLLLRNYRELKKIIERENPTITHIHQVNRVAYLASKILSPGKKHVVTAWGSDVLLVPKRNSFFRKIIQNVLRNASYITADSVDMINAIERLSGNNNRELVFFGIDQLDPLPKEKIVYSNRSLKELYNIGGIIDEFFEFQKSNPGWKLIIAGNGPEKEALVAKTKQLGIAGKTEFVGWLDTAHNNAYYQRAMVYISMPFSDGTSVSLLEAMSAGCIPVVSDLPVAYEWIENGKNGVIKKTGQNAIGQALNLDAGQVQKINRSLIEEKATSKIATLKFGAIYDKLLHDPAPKK
jgi:L-malate glycosyltransferase